MPDESHYDTARATSEVLKGNAARESQIKDRTPQESKGKRRRSAEERALEASVRRAVQRNGVGEQTVDNTRDIQQIKQTLQTIQGQNGVEVTGPGQVGGAIIVRGNGATGGGTEDLFPVVTLRISSNGQTVRMRTYGQVIG